MNIADDDDIGGMNMNISMSRSMKSSGAGGDAGQQDSDNESGSTLNEGDEEGEKEEGESLHVAASPTILPTSTETSLTGKELSEVCTISLEETTTTMLLSIRGVRIQNDTKEHARITEKNRRYEELVNATSSSDMFTTHSAQTFNFPTKSKLVDATPAPMRDSSTNATSWDIYDANQMNMKGTKQAARRSSMGMGEKSLVVKSDLTLYIEHEASITLASPGCLIPIDEDSNAKRDNNSRRDGAAVIQMAEMNKILSDKGLADNLCRAERIVQQNIFHKAHLLYRDIPDTASSSSPVTTKKDDDSVLGSTSASLSLPMITPVVVQTTGGDASAPGTTPSSPSGAAVSGGGDYEVPRSLELLWSFECAMTHGKNVSSFAWNKLNP